MKKIMLMLAMLLLLNNTAYSYETIGGESISTIIYRRLLIEQISKDNAEYIYKRIQWYSQIEDLDERTNAVYYMFEKIKEIE